MNCNIHQKLYFLKKLTINSLRTNSRRGCPYIGEPPTTTKAPSRKKGEPKIERNEKKEESEELALMDAKRARRLFDSSFLPVGVRDAKDARVVVHELHAGERKLLFDALRKIMADQYLEHKRLGNATIHIDDLVKLWKIYFIPSFIFGILDSALLIIGGKGISINFAELYGLSVLTSAALANVVSNLLLQRSQDHAVRLLGYLNIQRPVLTPEQMNNPDGLNVIQWARIVGLLIGSTIGLFPLLFFDDCFDVRSNSKVHWLEIVDKSYHREYRSSECGDYLEDTIESSNTPKKELPPTSNAYMSLD
ncbi:unnamed protein product [Caenorhabditis auriculariae]|uniref:Transmembrane protein 65 n=1 Tax=Caenorhabditis auriculariae TaxID=2777116 RepID=A0A8S1H2S4_9PELO|nr:unnamed protein product [Caenorhabditis auriculariae]